MDLLKTHLISTIVRKMCIGAILFAVIEYQTVFCQPNNICKVYVDSNGVMTSMVVTNPLTSLKIEKEFDFDVDSDGNPIKGTVKFVSSMYYGIVERELNAPIELNLMWQQFGGPQEYWENAKKHGKIIVYTSMEKLPHDVFGKKVHLYLNDGKEFFGRLLESASHPECVMLDTGGAQPLQIDKAIIREIQKVK